jgi:hypothetical protein
MTRVSRRWKVFGVGMAVTGGCCVFVLATHNAAAQPTAPVASQAGSGTGTGTVSRGTAEALLRNNTENVKALVRLESKEMSLGALRTAVSRHESLQWILLPQLADDSRLVWVVAMSGEFVPDVPGLPGGGPVPQYTWAVRVIDASSSPGLPLIDSVQAGKDGTWPPYFDELPDVGPP